MGSVVHRYAVLSVAILAWVGGCEDDAPAEGDGTTTTAGTTSTFGTSATSGDAADATGADGSTGVDPMGGECSLWEQDCPEGDKCVPWSPTADLVPDAIVCCPEVPDGKQPGDDCTVQDYFGSCLDDCAKGSICLDVDNDGQGVCQALCGPPQTDPTCQADESCLIYFKGVPICFPQCDPLVQDCAPGEGCYPDAEANGGTGFICLPTIGTGMGQCWLLSNCPPGLFCVTPDFLPDCFSDVGCCTPVCDTSEPDPCADIHPDLQCISWYYAGQDPPSVELQNVGVCVLPPS